jgi:hypothetical protein
MRTAGKTIALSHFGARRIPGGGGLSGSQADTRDYGDYAPLVARLREMIGWDKSRGWPAGALPGIGPFDRRVIAAGGIVFAVLMAVSQRYGFDRDELYFLDCARHLQASYVDQPVLAPLLAWVSLKLFGVSLPGLRVWPALAAWATVVVAGLTAREFGGRRRAQLLAAVGPGARRPAGHHHRGRRTGARRRRHRLRLLPLAVLHQRAGGGHAVQSARPAQQGMGRPRLYLHRPAPAVGPDMATAAPLRLTTHRRAAPGRRPVLGSGAEQRVPLAR